MIGFPLVLADSKLGWHTSALTTELQEVRQMLEKRSWALFDRLIVIIMG